MTDFWQEKRVLVTGGAGFLGSVVVEKLRLKQVKEVVVPRSRDCNLADAKAARKLYQETQPDLVIHLAAVVGGIGANRANPARFFYENMAMGLNVIEHARQFAVKKLVVLGTTCSYPKFTPVPFKETDLWNGYPEETNAPYGVAKRALHVMTAAYREQYGLNSLYLIPANLYGPRDNFDLETSHVIPALIRKFVEAKEKDERQVMAWGTGSVTREFLYVDDCAEGILLAAERYEKPDPVNLATGAEITIRDLVNLIKELVGYAGEVCWDTTKPDGQPRRCLDTSRARREFGFTAKTDLKPGLKKTIEWYEQNRH